MPYMHSIRSRSLVVDFMIIENYTKSYSKNLSSPQLNLINEWVINGTSPSLKSELKGARTICMDSIKEYQRKCNNNFVLENMANVASSIKSVNFDEVLTENHIIKAMTMYEIIAELSGEENE